MRVDGHNMKKTALALQKLLGAAAILLGSVSLAQAQDLVVAQIGPFTVLPSPDAHEINAGAKAYFAQVNERGGINGRRITVAEFDDKFNADEFVKQFDEAMKRKPVALLNPIGSATLARIQQDKLLDKFNVVVINAIPGADAFRKPGHQNLFHVRAGDRQQIEKIVGNAQSMGITKMHVLYQTLPIGAAGMAVAKELADKSNGQLTIKGTEAKHEDSALAEAARTVSAASPQGVLLVGTPKFMADGLKALRTAGVRQFVFALSYLPPGLAVKVAGPEYARGVGIAQAFPNPNGVSLALQRNFKTAMVAHNPKLTQFSSFHLEGYISAHVLTEGLKRAGPNPDAAALVKALRQMGEIDFGSFRVNFAQGNEGSRFVDVGVISASGALLY
jgi:branched-chain amino acid transport system substrate-binding protein